MLSRPQSLSLRTRQTEIEELGRRLRELAPRQLDIEDSRLLELVADKVSNLSMLADIRRMYIEHLEGQLRPYSRHNLEKIRTGDNSCGI